MCSTQQLLQFPTSELRLNAIEQTDLLLLKIVRANANTTYASKSPLLAKFRDAISVHGTASNAELVHDFRRCVPLSDYEPYKPFMAAFDASPCKQAEVEYLFAPGLPEFLALSSATSGKAFKTIPKYYPSIPYVSFGDGPAAAIFSCGYHDLKYVEGESGQKVRKIPATVSAAGAIRATLGWTHVDDDDSRMPVASVLACRDTDRIFLTFSTLFYDLLQFLDEQWDMFLFSIKNGTVPDLPGVQSVHSHLQVNFRANPERAAELREIGPPFSCQGWAARVWPKLKTIFFACSGPFASVLPKIKSVIGPTIDIHPNRYGSTESKIGRPYRPDDVHLFVLHSNDLIKFLDPTVIFISSIQALSPDIIHVNEFTTVFDVRRTPETVGYLIELAEDLGLNAHLAPLKLYEGLAAANVVFRVVLPIEKVREPSVRILRPGTFAAFRQWKLERLNIIPGQMKVPAVLLDEVSTKWLLDKVVTEP